MKRANGLTIITAVFAIAIGGLLFLYCTDTSNGTTVPEKIHNRAVELSEPVVEFFTGRNPTTGRKSAVQKKIDEDITTLNASIDTFNRIDDISIKKDAAETIIGNARLLSSDIADPSTDMEQNVMMAFGLSAEEVGIGRSDAERIQDPKIWDDYRMKYMNDVQTSYETYITCLKDAETDPDDIKAAEKTFIKAAEAFSEFAAQPPEEN